MIISKKNTREFSSDDHSFEVPLTKVLEILEDWKSKLDESESAKVDYIIDVIQKDSLYDIDVDSLVDKASDDETKFWIQVRMLFALVSDRALLFALIYSALFSTSPALFSHDSLSSFLSQHQRSSIGCSGRMPRSSPSQTR